MFATTWSVGLSRARRVRLNPRPTDRSECPVCLTEFALLPLPVKTGGSPHARSCTSLFREASRLQVVSDEGRQTAHFAHHVSRPFILRLTWNELRSLSPRPRRPRSVDGLGERRQIVDPTGNETIELLCLRTALAAVPSFEFALRERVSRLREFPPCVLRPCPLGRAARRPRDGARGRLRLHRRRPAFGHAGQRGRAPARPRHQHRAVPDSAARARRRNAPRERARHRPRRHRS